MKLSVKEIALFGMLGALMYASKMALEFLPNVHLLGVFTISMTVVYRKKALYPIYVFVFLLGLDQHHHCQKNGGEFFYPFHSDHSKIHSLCGRRMCVHSSMTLFACCL